MSKQSMQHQIDDLQSQLAFQEHTIESLNQALSSQQQQIAEMEHKLSERNFCFIIIDVNRTSIKQQQLRNDKCSRNGLLCVTEQV